MSYESELAAWGRAADAEVQDLGYQLIAAQSDDTADDAKILELETAILTKNGEIEFYLDKIDEKNASISSKDTLLMKKNATIARLRAERDALKADLAECQGTNLKK